MCLSPDGKMLASASRTARCAFGTRLQERNYIRATTKPEFPPCSGSHRTARLWPHSTTLVCSALGSGHGKRGGFL